MNGVAPQQVGQRRIDGALRVHEVAQALVLEKSDAPAVRMLVGAPATLGEAGEAEVQVGGRIGIHAEQLAHGRRGGKTKTEERAWRKAMAPKPGKCGL